MSYNINHWEWKSAADALEHLFQKHNGRVHIFTGTKNVLGGGCGVGSYQFVRKDSLVGRIYSVYFVDNSVGIDFHDIVFVDKNKNASYPEQTSCFIS